MRWHLAVLLPALGLSCATGAGPRRVEKIQLLAEPVEQALLRGPPQTGGMRSGRVVLLAGKDMHRHSTQGNEELLVFLEGRVRVEANGETLQLEAGQVLYIPPRTEHELHNDGPGDARYIYVVAPADR
jgi:mannose-6-phosphate isomerase-like protein (cupin superfamily)